MLLARIKAVPRRTERATSPLPKPVLLEIGDLVIYPAAHTVTLSGNPVSLSPREFALLHILALSTRRGVSYKLEAQPK